MVQAAAPSLYIGMMSGTSVDGIDAVLAETDPQGRLNTLLLRSHDLPDGLRTALLTLQSSGPDELARAAVARRDLSIAYAALVRELLADAAHALPGRSGLGPKDVAAIGAHGQTVRHRPEAGYTIQLLDGALLAVASGITVVNDLRSADVAAGGQGAPLAPGFHAARFGSPARRVVLNIGGIANVSLLDPTLPVIGYDTGPGNVLLDAWVGRHHGERYDAGGAWAAAAMPDPALLAYLLSEPYLALPAPKSTGRDLFNPAWLDYKLAAFGHSGPGQSWALANDEGAQTRIQSTLLQFTVETIAQACEHFAAADLVVCGGGARNAELMKRLQVRLAPTKVIDSGALGVDPQAVEALAFAWLARQRLQELPGNLPTVTGARGPAILGAVHAPLPEGAIQDWGPHRS